MTRREARSALAALVVATLSCADPPKQDRTVPSVGERGARATAMPESGAPSFTPRTASDRARWRARLSWPDDCDRAFTARGENESGIDVLASDGPRRLLQVSCAMGAYQGSYRYFVVDTASRGAKPTALVFRDVIDPGGGRLERDSTREIVGLPTWDAPTSRLIVLRKMRGPGDCGLLFTYRISDTTTTLVVLRAKRACDGHGASAPERWPLVPLR